MQIILKEAAKLKKVAFAGRALPLFLRSETDLKLLGIIAHESGDPSILGLFESLPSLADLKADKVSKELPVLPELQPIQEKPKRKKRVANKPKK